MGKLDEYLDTMLEQTETLEDYEADEMLEELENYAIRRGNPQMLARISQAKRGRGFVKMGKGSPGVKTTRKPLGVAGATPRSSFTLKISRLTANIAGKALPFALFGPIDLQNGYLNVLNPLIPAGVVLDFVRIGRDNTSNANATRAQFQYTEGANTDIVQVECQQIAYPMLVESIKNADFQISQMRYSISDVAQLSQFENQIKLNNRSIFGKNTEDSLTPIDYKAPEQFQAGIIDLLGVVWDVEKEFTAVSLINASAGFSMSLSCFVSALQK